MPWIRIQGLKKDDAGRITAGTATVVDTGYVQSTKGAKQHSKQITREKHGRPLVLAADRRSGIFRSQEYGIVAYDADTDSKEVLEMDDSRLEGFIEAVSLDVHTVFGDGFLFLSYLKNMGLTDMISAIVYLSLRKDLLSTELALTEVPAITQSLMCALGKDGMVRVDPPNAQVKRVYKVFGIKLPNQFPLEDFIAGSLS